MADNTVKIWTINELMKRYGINRASMTESIKMIYMQKKLAKNGNSMPKQYAYWMNCVGMGWLLKTMILRRKLKLLN